MDRTYGFTLVQHSAYGYKGDPEFRRGLESRELKTKAEYDTVKRIGGLVLDSYAEAETRAQSEMYPPNSNTFLTPVARGTFAVVKIGGLAVYIPQAAA